MANPKGKTNKYKSEYAEQAYKLCLLGATDKEMADFFNVVESTINNWKRDHKDFLESITRGKMLADANVAEKLYSRACGYSHIAVKIFNNNGEIITKEYTEHYPPDTQAASFWLRNRQPPKWRDKVEVEHDGDIGLVVKTINYSKGDNKND